MKLTKTTSDLLLLLAAIIWGFAFVAQRMGMENVGPFVFNACRFLLGGLILIPIAIRQKPAQFTKIYLHQSIKGGIIAGILLFGGATFQQMGIVYTTAGNAGFITGIYVVLVPAFGIVFLHKTSLNVWAGAVLALLGMYFLSVTSAFVVSKGDILVLIGAFIWAFHVLFVGKYAPMANVIIIAIIQFFICGILSLVFAVFAEPIEISGIMAAGIPILYGGIFSVAIAFTLQVVVQKNAHPSLTAIILSTEALFAALGGWLILDEKLTARAMFGCVLMLFGMIIAQINFTIRLAVWKKQKINN
ncbi:MAG: DMT family transporter [Bacteroidetes bacterium]|nr:DMT family transporter [Bacteroidota bacterium]